MGLDDRWYSTGVDLYYYNNAYWLTTSSVLPVNYEWDSGTTFKICISRDENGPYILTDKKGPKQYAKNFTV